MQPPGFCRSSKRPAATGRLSELVVWVYLKTREYRVNRRVGLRQIRDDAAIGSAQLITAGRRSNDRHARNGGIHIFGSVVRVISQSDYTPVQQLALVVLILPPEIADVRACAIRRKGTGWQRGHLR